MVGEHGLRDLVRVHIGQQFLEALPDERLEAGVLTRDAVVGGLVATFSPSHRVADAELAAAWELISAGGGERLLATKGIR